MACVKDPVRQYVLQEDCKTLIIIFVLFKGYSMTTFVDIFLESFDHPPKPSRHMKQVTSN